MKNLIKRIIKSGIISWGALLVIWGVVSLFYTDTFFPSPVETVKGFNEILLNGKLWEDISISGQRVLIGWIRALLIGVPVGLLIGRFRIVNWFIEPFINFFRFVPAIGFLTLFLMWFGVGEESKLILITYASIFPIIINTIAGVNTINPVKYQAAESLGANKIQSFITVTIPGAVPSILTGARLGLSTAIISIVGAEMLAANSGLGYLVYTSRLYYRTDWIFVGIVTLGVLGFFADKFLRFVAKKSLKHYGVTG
ncbi:NitT/TauT family transport system permease protein [Pseudobutyrivibrio ruminis]|uniref:NitT/TauT family transport system permease protein n=1 Tax=Pseudobutyrivibrio ruminis TaxID=46206 RepID=A0A1H7K3W8_9FIRM|nr:ABC transporter permease [Pseudobutyrivibrio ruminis]SEK80585.1 NitT/TauT family transport system permease protein [Pseudobutyrivibrio ruminis]